MRVGAVIALLIGIALAIPGIAQEHSGPPGNTPEEECQRQCHVKHCDDFVACLGKEDVTLCRRNVTQQEVECMKKCEPPRG